MNYNFLAIYLLLFLYVLNIIYIEYFEKINSKIYLTIGSLNFIALVIKKFICKFSIFNTDVLVAVYSFVLSFVLSISWLFIKIVIFKKNQNKPIKFNLKQKQKVEISNIDKAEIFNDFKKKEPTFRSRFNNEDSKILKNTQEAQQRVIYVEKNIDIINENKNKEQKQQKFEIENTEILIEEFIPPLQKKSFIKKIEEEKNLLQDKLQNIEKTFNVKIEELSKNLEREILKKENNLVVENLEEVSKHKQQTENELKKIKEDISSLNFNLKFENIEKRLEKLNIEVGYIINDVQNFVDKSADLLDILHSKNK